MGNIDKFIYVHILKTAGTTMRHTLFEQQFKGRYLYDDTFKLKRNKTIKTKHPLIIEQQRYPSVDYKKYDVIFGHFKHDKYEHLNRPMVSFVRNPVDRMINHYHYHKMIYERKGQKLSLLEFSEMWKNHMTYILGDISKYKFIGNVENFKKSLDGMCDSLGIAHPKKIISRRIDRNNQVRKTSSKVKKKIEKLNSEDMELYSKVIKKWR
jgi:hypothetical protein